MLLALLSIASATPMVAFTAQHYSHHKSTGPSQVYVCDLDGGHRRVVTHERTDCGDVQWDGPDNLCYVVDDRVIKKLNIRTKVSRVVFRLKVVRPLSESEIKSQNIRLRRGTNQAPRYIVDWREVYDVIGIHAVRRRVPPHLAHLPIHTQIGTVKELAGGAIVLSGHKSRIVLDEGYGNGVESFADAWVRGGKFYFIRTHTMSTTGEISYLNVLRGGTPVEILRGNELDADVSKQWIGCSVRNAVFSRSRWYRFSSIEVKNLRTGESRFLNDGGDDATSISLSPNAP